MLNDSICNDLRKAERVFRKQGRPVLAGCARDYRGHLADCAATGPNDTLVNNINNVLNIAFGGPIHV